MHNYRVSSEEISTRSHQTFQSSLPDVWLCTYTQEILLRFYDTLQNSAVDARYSAASTRIDFLHQFFISLTLLRIAAHDGCG